MSRQVGVPQHLFAALVLSWFGLGAWVVILTQWKRLPFLVLGEIPLGLGAGLAAFALVTQRRWAGTAVKVVAVAAVALVAGMVMQFPPTLGGDAWLSGLLALGVWCPSWWFLANKVQAERAILAPLDERNR